MCKSDFCLKSLLGAGISVLAFSTHTATARPSGAAADAYTRYLLAALEHAARHPRLRYCRIALFAQGVGASATLRAFSRAPAAFEARLKCLVLCEPAEVNGLVDCIPHVRVPTLLLTRAAGGGGGDDDDSDVDDDDDDDDDEPALRLSLIHI